MSGRREVNVGRPEHSWIPFYRELAEKLVNEGWRDRQGELVGVLQRLQANGIPMPRLVEFMRDDVDPFTVFALFSRVLSFENASRVMKALKAEFVISVDLPAEQPFIPYADNRSVGYFSGFVDIAHEVATMWDLFEIVYEIDDFDEVPKHGRLAELIDEALEVNYVGISKLTSALYWVNPYHFLHSHTVNAVGGKDSGFEARDAESYIKCLVRTAELTERSFPETNITVFKSQNPDWEPPRVWIVRGGASGQSVDYQLENGVAGVGFLGDVDLSGILDGEAIREAYASRNPDANDGRVRANAGSVANFVRDIRICDYVLMPDGDRQRIHYGRVVSDPYHVPNGRWQNRRDIEWADRVMSRSDLPSLPPRTRTVTQATDRLRDEVLSGLEKPISKMPGLDNGGTNIVGPYDVAAMLREGVFLEESEIHQMMRILRSKKNLILQGPPGVGKTFIARKLAYVLMGSKSENRITSVQFHQSYSYEDFVGGFRPDVEDGQMVFTRQAGPFLRMCAEARANPDNDYVILIDEINRGNLSRVFGELLMLIEADKRRAEFGVKLQHRPDDEGFFVPENVYIIGTMNLADRSLTGMNVAMRRRFGFVDLKPQFNERVFTDWLSNETAMPPNMQSRVLSKMSALNSTIADDPSLGVNYAVGHSFFCPPDGEPAAGWEEWYETVVNYEIRPLLREYWFDDPDTANREADRLFKDD